MMLSCDPTKGKYISANVFFRGKTGKKAVDEVCDQISESDKYKWVKDVSNLKWGRNSQTPSFVPTGEIAAQRQSATMLGNTTAIVDKFKSIGEDFDKLYGKRAFKERENM